MYRKEKRFFPLQLKSLPFPSQTKRYWFGKYEHIRTHEGPKAASSTFKTLREHIMRLVNKSPGDLLRLANGPRSLLTEEFSDVRIQKNNQFRILLRYAANDPVSVLQLLKLYTTERRPIQRVDESADETHLVIQTKEGPRVPLLSEWCKLISYPFGVFRKEHSLHKRGYGFTQGTHMVFHNGQSWEIPGLSDPDPEKRLLARMLHRSIYPRMDSPDGQRTVKRYLSRWNRVLTPTVASIDRYYDIMREWLPHPEMYSDFGLESGTKTDICNGGNAHKSSGQFMQDTMEYLALRSLSPEVVEPLDSLLSPDFRQMLNELWIPDGGLPQHARMSFDIERPETWYHTVPAGHIHHIPKKGTVKRRAIAAPNRYFQVCMKPFQMFLRSVTRQLPQNCQFDQRKLDQKIQKTLDAGDFIGCWDLSRATDYLPFNWFIQLCQGLFWFSGRLAETESLGLVWWSFCHYMAAARGHWLNGYNYSQWRRGQPLGTWPSFEVLSLTHHLLLEAISVYIGRLDSPYGICGDDNVIFDQSVYTLYRRLMDKAGNPISEGKSFSGRLIEFTGKLFVTNQSGAYAPDLVPITFTSLFDYQRASGHYLKWEDLPDHLRHRFVSTVGNTNAACKPRDVYIACQAILNIPCPELSERAAELVTLFYARIDEANGTLVAARRVWTVGFDDTHTFSLGNESRHVRGQKPPDKWFIRKYRPYDTNALVRMVASAKG